MISRILRTLATALVAAVIGADTLQAAQMQASTKTRPNIIWFVVDDMSANFSCYGAKTIRTPHVDQLVRQGLRFTRA